MRIDYFFKNNLVFRVDSDKDGIPDDKESTFNKGIVKTKTYYKPDKCTTFNRKCKYSKVVTNYLDKSGNVISTTTSDGC